MVNVVIIMWQGVIEDVKVFWNPAIAEGFFATSTNVAWSDFKSRIETEDSETILGNYAGSNIWELKIE